ncbi:MAG: hypothetical protein LBK60_09700 [Verrucomicrobiales bacterium]|jgi:hypothetical protein|nr:hypothetical protein [Verrucomicrobiales bacterium]
MALTPEELEVVKAATKIGLRIQHRFKPEPLYAATGVGYMKSEGVSVMQKVKAGVARTQARRALAHAKAV